MLAFPIPTFVPVPAGEFLMGTSHADIEQLLKMKEMQEWAKDWKEKGWFKSEQPQHRVTLDEFQIGKYPVTNAQYQAFIQATDRQPPSYWSDGTFAEEIAAYPVVYVSWKDAAAYCEWLTQQLRIANQLRENESIRLPTEAEWEKAASWDDEKKAKGFWPWGNIWDAAKCNTAESGIGTTTPVGKYSPAGDSFYGAADMAGNVLEWCADWYDENYYKNLALSADEASPDKNPTEPDSRQARSLRGGSWFNYQFGARCAFRNWTYPDDRYGYVGFRCARGFSG